jgi:hypothetical protein
MLDVLADPGRSVARLRSHASHLIHGPAICICLDVASIGNDAYPLQ